jgi:hypothetical protein
MANNIEIPNVTLSPYFGSVNKVRWYSVLDRYNYYDITLNVYRSQFTDTAVTIENLSNGSVWGRTIPKSTNTDPVVISDKLLHIPGLSSQIYGVYNR